MNEEQHSSILLACKEIIENYLHETVDPSIGGPRVAKTMENLGVSVRAHRLRLKSGIGRFTKDPELRGVAKEL